ncbi:MAG TPA: thioredoxin family protein [Acidimicrobiia bacterium]|nr:thioredoxin family protein [Acidimicrobiia bacterium]
MRRLLPASVLVMAALTSACSSGPAPLTVVANAPGTFDVGEPQRLLVGIVDAETGGFLASPELEANAVLVAPDMTERQVPTEFLWTVPDRVGIYLIRDTFDQEGTWWVKLRPQGMTESMQASFIVGNDDPMPGVGEPAISIETRTAAEHPLEEISSDPDPDPSFYELSLDQALTNGQPTVVVFASPAFCTSQTCGPMLDQVEAVASEHPGVNYLHVEIYENLDAETSAELQISDAVLAWGLPSEPWVFVIDRDGRVSSRFEGALGDGEIEGALAAVGA